jgi:hypothetical protein
VVGAVNQVLALRHGVGPAGVDIGFHGPKAPETTNRMI